MASKIQQKKEALISAYSELSSSFVKTSVAINEFTSVLRNVDDPAELDALVGNFPTLAFGQAPVGKGRGLGDGEEVEKKRRKKKDKKPKDPDAPKRPPSAYIEFQNSVRQKFRDDDPELSYGEILRKIAGAWSELPDAEKKTWHEVTAQKARDYETAKASYDQGKLLNGDVDVPMGDIVVGDSAAAGLAKTLGKDGKEYTGKKRGRKSNADKLREAEEAASATIGGAAPDSSFLQSVAKHVVDAGPSSDKKKEKKESKSPAKAVSIPVQSSSEEDDDDDDESDDDSSGSEESSDEESEATPAPIPVPAPKPNSSSKSSKRAAEDASGKKKKSKAV